MPDVVCATTTCSFALVVFHGHFSTLHSYRAATEHKDCWVFVVSLELCSSGRSELSCWRQLHVQVLSLLINTSYSNTYSTIVSFCTPMFYSTVSPRKYTSFEQTQSPLFNPHFLAYYRYFSPCKCPMVSVYLNIISQLPLPQSTQCTEYSLCIVLWLAELLVWS